MPLYRQYNRRDSLDILQVKELVYLNVDKRRFLKDDLEALS